MAIRERDYDALGRFLVREPVLTHPLAPRGPARVVGSLEAARRSVADATATPSPVLDPLSAFAEDADPLRVLSVRSDNPGDGGGSGSGAGGGGGRKSVSGGSGGGGGVSADRDVAESFEHSDDVFGARATKESWRATAAAIMKEFTVSGKIRVTAAFLTGSVEGAEEGTVAPIALDKARARLEVLEGHVEDKVEVTQKEYMASIERLHSELRGAWERGAWVTSVKLAIQTSKLLLDTKIPQFYPSMFVLVTEILDTFGEMVFRRIYKRSIEADASLGGRASLPPDFSSDDVSVEAKETCRNWIYKTACIRELLPRLYLELALLPCYRFIVPRSELAAILARLSSTIRGIGNPQVAVYARTYLARKVGTILSGATGRAKLVAGVQDYLFTFQELRSERARQVLGSVGVPMNECLRVEEPAIGWQLTQLGDGAGKDVFTAVLQAYREYCCSSMVLKHIILSFDPALWAPHAVAMATLIKDAEASNVPLCEVYKAFAEGLTRCAPPAKSRLTVLNDSWRVIAAVADPVLYASCAASFIGLIRRHYSERELAILLSDVVRHMSVAVADTGVLPPAVVPHLERIVTFAADGEAHAPAEAGGGSPTNGAAGTPPPATESGVSAIVTSDAFVKVLDLFESDTKTHLCKQLLSSFTRSSLPTGDPVLIHTVFDIARNVHDRLDSLSIEDERRQIAVLICKFVDKIDFGRDLEQQLNVLVDCRAAFLNLDSVLDHLVLAVLRLAMRALRIMKGRHTKKTVAFVKACFAYCHITIPSIGDVFKRVGLFLVCGQCALVNRCLPQADTFFKEVVHDLAEVAAFMEAEHKRYCTEPRLAWFLHGFISAVLPMPGHPDRGPFYLVRGVLSCVERYSWQDGSDACAQVLLSLLSLLAAYGQRVLPVRVPGVESNDALYARDPAYVSQLADFVTQVIGLVNSQIDKLLEASKTDFTAKPRVAAVALRFVGVLVSGYVVDHTVAELITRLLNTAISNGTVRLCEVESPALDVCWGQCRSRTARTGGDCKALQSAVRSRVCVGRPGPPMGGPRGRGALSVPLQWILMSISYATQWWAAYCARASIPTDIGTNQRKRRATSFSATPAPTQRLPRRRRVSTREESASIHLRRLVRCPRHCRAEALCSWSGRQGPVPPRTRRGPRGTGRGWTRSTTAALERRRKWEESGLHGHPRTRMPVICHHSGRDAVLSGGNERPREEQVCLTHRNLAEALHRKRVSSDDVTRSQKLCLL